MLAPDTHLKERYRILQKIGGGGFGDVYKAMDEVFGCCVAIKETKEKVLSHDKLKKAFEREAKLLRNLKHDCLPRVTDYFCHDEVQFLVMDFIEGEDLAALLHQRLGLESPFTVSEILPWADRILSALEYLHSLPEPIIHRDIKPSNIKLADDGGIYLLDFGLAKGSAGQMSTMLQGQSSFSVAAFTHEYAPLEQLQDTGTQPQSDIYAFGATLYHLLTGHPPVSASKRDEAIQRGLNDPLGLAHQVNPAIPIVISQIISQAMIVRWWDRLASAKEMRAALHQAAAEVSNLQAEPDLQPVSPSAYVTQDKILTLPLPEQSFASSKDSRPTIPPQAAAKAARPYRSWLVAGVSVVVLVGIAIGSRLTFPHWFVTTISSSTTQTPTPGNAALLVTPTDLRPRPLFGHRKTVFSVAFSPDGTIAASGSEDATAILWDTRTWTELHRLTGHGGPIYSVAFSPDGKMLATASEDKSIRLWNTQTGAFMRMSPHKYSKAVQRLSFSTDGGVLASFSGDKTGGEQQIQLWYLNNNLSEALSGHAKGVQAIVFLPRSKSLFSSGYEKESGREKNTLRLWNLATGKSEELKVYSDVPRFLAASEDGKHMACGTSSTIEIWFYRSATRSWEEQWPLVGLDGEVTSLAFSPDNKTLVTITDSDTIALWDITSPSSQPVILEHSQIREVQWSSAFSPNAQTLLTGGKDNFVWLWERPNQL